MTVPERRQFEIEHTSEFRYAEPARGSLLVLRLRPRQDRNQRLLEFALRVDPASAAVSFEDSFGNLCHLANIHRKHGRTVVRASSRVEVADPPAASGHLETASWDAFAAAADPVRYWEYLNPSRLAFACPALDSFTAANGIRRGADPWSSLRDAASTLHSVFTYEPGSTEVHSSIEDILETGRGVCQDYAHVMLAIARSWGIPSRYVSGYLHGEGMSGEQSAASASHAWAEFLVPGSGWVGLDPTNDTVADHRHVPVAVGRDYFDAAPTRGTVFGGGKSSLEVRVSVAEADRSRPQQQLRIERRALHPVVPTPLLQKTTSDQ